MLCSLSVAVCGWIYTLRLPRHSDLLCLLYHANSPLSTYFSNFSLFLISLFLSISLSCVVIGSQPTPIQLKRALSLSVLLRNRGFPGPLIRSSCVIGAFLSAVYPLLLSWSHCKTIGSAVKRVLVIS